MSVGNEGTRAYGGPVTNRGPRVLLFVQAGDARPKCVYRDVPEWMSRRAGEKLRELYYEKSLGSVRLAWMYGEWVKPFRAADRWWLVECANADAGRVLIALSVLRAYGPVAEKAAAGGRILASGGRP